MILNAATNAGNSTLSIIITIVSMIMSVVAAACYAPGVHKLLKTRDTRGTSLSMWIMAFVSNIIWVVIGALIAINSFKTTGSNVEWVSAWIGIAVSNSGLLVCSSIILYIKVSNLRNAKKLGVSEEKYVEQLTKLIKEEKAKK